MRDVILGLAIVGIVIFGFYLMKRLDRFLRRHYKSRKIEPDLNESSIVIFSKPNERLEEKQEEETGEERDRRQNGKDCRGRHSSPGYL